MSQGSVRRRARRPPPAAPRTGGRASDIAEVVNDLRRLFKAIHEYSKAILRKTGLSGPQLWALTVLYSAPALSLNELSERLFAHPSTVSGIVDRLEERGAVRKEPDPEDRRGIRLSLTGVGRRLVRRSPPPVQVGLRRTLEEMPALQLRRLRLSLDQLVRETAARRIEALFFDVEDDVGPRSRRRR
jgi:DNA-binding MarR family transcriptional regulator